MEADPTLAMHPGAFPPIADYAFLSDCESTCLVAPNGGVEWMCVPRPDSPSVFGAMLDRSAGTFRVGPYEVSVPAARRYLPGSLIARDDLGQTATGWLIVREVYLVMGPWQQPRRSVPGTHRRSPSDYDAEHWPRNEPCAVCPARSIWLMELRPRLRLWPRARRMMGVRRARLLTNMGRNGRGRAPRCDSTSDLRCGIEGRVVRARTRMSEGDGNASSPLSWSPPAGPDIPSRRPRARHSPVPPSTGAQWITRRRVP